MTIRRNISLTKNKLDIFRPRLPSPGARTFLGLAMSEEQPTHQTAILWLQLADGARLRNRRRLRCDVRGGRDVPVVQGFFAVCACITPPGPRPYTCRLHAKELTSHAYIHSLDSLDLLFNLFGVCLPTYLVYPATIDYLNLWVFDGMSDPPLGDHVRRHLSCVENALLFRVPAL